MEMVVIFMNNTNNALQIYISKKFKLNLYRYSTTNNYEYFYCCYCGGGECNLKYW